MARQANLPWIPVSKVDSPDGGTTGVLFIDKDDNNKMKFMTPEGDVLTGAVNEGGDLYFVEK